MKSDRLIERDGRGDVSSAWLDLTNFSQDLKSGVLNFKISKVLNNGNECKFKAQRNPK